MNNRTEGIGVWIKTDASFHPNCGRQTSRRRLRSEGTTLLELLPAPARAGIISSDSHFDSFRSCMYASISTPRQS
jgi:hypothetical protein